MSRSKSEAEKLHNNNNLKNIAQSFFDDIPNPLERKDSSSFMHTDKNTNSPPKQKVRKRVEATTSAPKDGEEHKKPPQVIRVTDETPLRKKPKIGVYVPPHKQTKKDPSSSLVENSAEYQRQAWFALKGSINVCINKADASNIRELVVDLLKENLIWGKGLLVRTLMRSQMAAPGYSNVLAAVASVVNTKLPEVGELLCKRLVIQFKRSFRRNDKMAMISAIVFLAHLVNQFVVSELLALELLSLLLEKPTDDSVEVAIYFIKQCGARLLELTPKGTFAIFETFRAIVNEGKVDKRVQYSIEGVYTAYRDKFAKFPAVISSLDLVDDEDAILHEIHLKDSHQSEDLLDVFREMDPKAFREQKQLYDEIKDEILGDSSGEEEEGDEENGEENGEEMGEEEDEEEDKNKVSIEDRTSTDLTNLRRSIYLTIMSSINHDESAHKILKIQIKEKEEHLVAAMIVDVCANERTYQKDIGQLGERLCKINPQYVEAFDDLFGKRYTIMHRYETTKIRNMAKFFAYLVVSEALPWDILEYIHLSEPDTTSSSRIFIKVLFKTFSYWLGVNTLKAKVEEERLEEPLSGIFPRDNPKNIRFSINFFTSVGLGALTEKMREYLDTMQKAIEDKVTGNLDSSGDDSSSDSSDSSGSSDSSESGDESGGSSDSSDESG